ncbi:type III pantothenate kinase [Aquiflexum sp. LQ15W]|uniref:type III pantothenate kinase n=1 Tax=Cognataquiflexum nitidum TaxID=2922272 RepID=UPI001F13F153|nr:type III pantothenate kinase [Cognataquiflexum nitidum]MCH6199851.1 type III pantothenate kinase [Cognataquiflexum nitidum]
MKQLVVDIGNTRIKAAVFEGDILLKEFIFEDFSSFLNEFKSRDFEHAIISSVTYTEEQLLGLLDFPFLFLSYKTPLPFKNMYTTPDTLGVDRKAAVAGGRNLFQDCPILAIDLGSCITYDFMDESDRYLGGAITPGLQMRFKAMSQLTARLPLVDFESGMEPRFIGDSTVSCLRSGVFYGIQFEMRGFIREYQAQYHGLKVIICGGDSKIFESLTKDHIFVIPNLVLHGLNRILSYNVNYQ